MRKGLRPELALESAEGLLAYLGQALPKEVLDRASRLALLGEVDEEEGAFLLPYAEDLLLERREGRICFHPLVRSALKALLPEGEARGLLARAAEAALARGEGVRAAEFLLEAGRFGHAADLLLKEGEGWLARGLTYTVLRLLGHLPEGVRRGRAGLRLLEAEALRQAGRYREAEALYREALEAGEERAYLGLVRLFLDTVEPARAKPFLEEALRRFPGLARPLLAENLLNEGRAGEAEALGFSGPRLFLRQGRPAEALELLKRAEDPGLHRPPQNHREGSLLRALLECVAGDAEEGLRFAERGRFEAEALGSPFGLSLAEARKGHALLALGRLREAEASYRAALALSEGAVDDGFLGRSAKLQRLEEILDEVIEAGDRALLFTQFAEWGHLLQAWMQQRWKSEVPFLHGGTRKSERQAMVDRFQEDPRGPQLFLLSLKAGGVGLNLTRASHVFHIDRWWNPAVENQATDRAYRIGQTNRVMVHKFITSGSVEEKIDRMIREKSRLAEDVIGSGEDWLGSLGGDQLRNLVALEDT